MLNIGSLYHQVNDVELYNGLSLSLAAGSHVVVTGPNGSGKSTLLRILAGLLTPHQADFTYAAGLTAFVGDKIGVSDVLTVRENLEWYQSMLTPRTSRQSIVEAAGRMNISKLLNRSAAALSAGQVRRISLARLLVADHDLWVLDEPLNNLDEPSQKLFEVALDQHLERNGAAVCATHQPLAVASTSQLCLPPA